VGSLQRRAYQPKRLLGQPVLAERTLRIALSDSSFRLAIGSATLGRSFGRRIRTHPGCTTAHLRYQRGTRFPDRPYSR